MEKNFDRIFIYWIDRIVWCILIVVISNLVVEITGISTASKSASAAEYNTDKPKIIVSAKLSDALPPEKQIEEFLSNEVFENQGGVTTKRTPSRRRTTKSSDKNVLYSPDRNAVFDNIFNACLGAIFTCCLFDHFQIVPAYRSISIAGWFFPAIPISTLQSVNSLVQTIANAILPSGRSHHSGRYGNFIKYDKKIKNFTTYTI